MREAPHEVPGAQAAIPILFVESVEPQLRAYAWGLRVMAFIAVALLLKKLGLGDLIGTIIKAL